MLTRSHTRQEEEPEATRGRRVAKPQHPQHSLAVSAQAPRPHWEGDPRAQHPILPPRVPSGDSCQAPRGMHASASALAGPRLAPTQPHSKTSAPRSPKAPVWDSRRGPREGGGSPGVVGCVGEEDRALTLAPSPTGLSPTRHDLHRG